jgi:WD40 repeat protein
MFLSIDAAEVSFYCCCGAPCDWLRQVDSDNSIDFEILPIRELQVPPLSRINCLVRVRTKHEFLCIDMSGSLRKVYVDRQIADEALLETHSGTITGMETCPNDSFVATCGVDGTVRCWDYNARYDMLLCKAVAVCSHIAGDSCLSARTTCPQHACDGFRCLLMAVGKRSV